MKKLFLAVVVSLWWTSCMVVRFENPQPKDVVGLSNFPEQMRGNFISAEQDTLEIDSLGFHFRNGEDINLQGDLSSASTVLKALGKYYVISIAEQEIWDVFPVRVKKDRITLFYSSLSSDVEELMENLEETSQVKKVVDSTGHLDYYLIDPTPEEFRTLLRRKLYNEKLIFERSN